MDEPWRYLLLFIAGVATGTLNVLAGGGSFLSLPILMFLGLPAGVANATNRIGILIQNVAAVGSFHRQRTLDGVPLTWTLGPAAAGGLLGAWGALHISDYAFRSLLPFLMVGLTVWSLLSSRESSAKPTAPVPLLALGFFGAGLYGGFVQAGVGFLLLAVTTRAGLDLVRGNALKVAAVLCFTALALVVFAAGGKLDWPFGLALGSGSFIGGLLGARLTTLKGHAWLKRVVLVAVVVFAVKLWIER